MRTFRVIVADTEYEVAIEEITDKAAPNPVPAKTVAAPAPAAPAAEKPTAQTTNKPTAPTPGAGEGTIVAAMPGTILEVRVNPGESVKRGDTVMILEAMKMENEIKAPTDGVVSSVEVAKGATVNAGMVLMILT